MLTHFTSIYNCVQQKGVDSPEKVFAWNDGDEKSSNSFAEYVQMINEKRATSLKRSAFLSYIVSVDLWN